MRRLLNFIFILVLVGSVGYIFIRPDLLPLQKSSPLGSNPSASPSPSARKSLRVCVVGRPEVLLVNALKRLLETEGQKVEIRAYDVETSWMELAAGEIDLMIAPIGEAIIGQARFQAGQFLFTSGLSTGYDVVLASKASATPPQSLGIVNGQGCELFAIAKFPNSQLLAAENEADLQNWLAQGAVQAAVLQKASLSGELSKSMVSLSATDSQHPMPTIVVLSQAMRGKTSANEARVDVLLALLGKWKELIGYLERQPDLLRSILKREADELGIDLDIMLKSYSFLRPEKGREALLKSLEEGKLKETLDLLALARVSNLTTPNWQETLEPPSYLAEVLLEAGSEALSSSAGVAPNPDEPTALASPVVENSQNANIALGSRQFPGPAPKDPWPTPVNLKVSQSLGFSPAITDDLIAVATIDGLSAYLPNGELSFKYAISNLAFKPLANPNALYLLTVNSVTAIDTSGAELWRLAIPGKAVGDPVLTSDNLIIPIETENGEQQILTLSAENGSIKWQNSLKEPITSPIVSVADDKAEVLLTNGGGTLSCWQAEQGNLLWEASLSSLQALPLAVKGNLLAVAYPNGDIELRSLNNSSIIWQTSLKTALSAAPSMTADGATLLIPAASGTLYGLAVDSGQLAYKESISPSSLSAPVVVDDHAYLSDQTGSLHCLAIKDAGLSRQWSKPLGLTTPTELAFKASFWLLGPGKDHSLLIYSR